MAKPPSPKKLREIEKLIIEGEKLAERIDDAEKNAFDTIAQQARTGAKTIKQMVEEIDRLEKKVRAVEEGFLGLSNQIKGSLGVLGSSTDPVKDLDKAYKSLQTLVSKLTSDELDIERLSRSQLENIQAKVKFGKEQAVNAAQLVKNNQALYDSLTEAQKAEIDNVLQNKSAYDVTLDQLKERLELEKKYEQALGISGALMNNLGKIGIRAFGGIGISLGSLTDLIKESQEAMDKAARKFAETQTDTDNFFTKIRVMGAGLKPLAKNIFKALADPLPLLALLLSGFKEFDKQASNFQRNTGRMMSSTAGLNFSVASTVQVMEQLNEIVKLTNINPIDIFTTQELADAAELALLTNMTAEDAAKLNIYSKITGTSLKNNNKEIVQSVNRYNAINKTAVAHGVVQSDIAKTSASTAVSMGLQFDRMTMANASARRLGLTLKDIEQIQKGLLEFESSIEAELEAQLLTGKQINLNKARELALTNQLDKLGDELFKNSTDIAEFGKMNYIQQESLASAMGLTRDQLAQIAIQRGLDQKLSREALANAMNMSEEDLQRLEAQQMITQSIQKMTTAIAPFLYAMTEIVGHAGVLKTIFTIIGAVLLLKMVAGIIAAVTGVYSLLAGLMASAVAAGIITGVITLVAVAGTAALITSTIAAAEKESPASPVTKFDDVYIDKNGNTKSGPPGTISLNSEDDIIAGTNLFGDGGSRKKILAKLDRLIAAVEKGGNVYLDGNKVGQALVLGSYATD